MPGHLRNSCQSPQCRYSVQKENSSRIRSLLLYRLLLNNANVCRCSKFMTTCASNDDNVHAM